MGATTYVPAKDSAGGAVWGAITGTLADQTDLKAVTDNKVDKISGKGLSTNDYTDIDEAKVGFISVTQAVNLDTMESDIANKQATLVSGTNIKTINSTSLLGSGDIVVGGDWGDIGGDITNQTDLNTILTSVQNQITGLSASLFPQGNWDADTNTPDISTAQEGDFWIVSTAGATDLDGITDWQVNDWAVKTEISWAKVDNSELVTSVAGKTGDVTLDKSDVGLSNVDNTSDANKPVSTAQQAEIDTKQAGTAFVTQSNLTINGSSGNFFLVSISASSSFTLSNIATGVQYYIRIYNSSASAITITLPNTADIKAVETFDIDATSYKEVAMIYDGTNRTWQISETLI